MAAKTFSFESGVNGNSVTTGAGEASADALNSVFGTAPKYDTTHISHGALAAKFTTSSGRLAWTVTPSGTFYGRLYVYLPANPSINTAIVIAGNAQPNITTTGLMRAGLVNGTVAMTLNAWVRIEYQVIFDASVGQLVIRLYNSPDSTTITETVSSAANISTTTTTSIEAVRITDTNWFAGSWADQLVANATNWVGPFPVNSVAPVVTGSTPVGSTLTTTDGTWNNTFTMTYQWTKAGVNIGGATSSTYVTVSGDAGSAIACKVTATGVQATNEAATQASSNSVTPTGTPVNTVAPAVTGTQTVGSTLTTTNGTWTDAGSPAFTYQWQRGGVNIGSATSSTYVLVDADDATNVRCVVTDTDANGATSANSNAVAILEPVPTNSVAPVASGSVSVGSVVSATTGTWTHQGGTVATYTYQWQDSADGSTGWANISGKTSSTYTVLVAELTKYLRCNVTATNSGGAGSAASSNALGPVTAAVSSSGGAYPDTSATTLLLLFGAS